MHSINTHVQNWIELVQLVQLEQNADTRNPCCCLKLLSLSLCRCCIYSLSIFQLVDSCSRSTRVSIALTKIAIIIMAFAWNIQAINQTTSATNLATWNKIETINWMLFCIILNFTIIQVYRLNAYSKYSFLLIFEYISYS